MYLRAVNAGGLLEVPDEGDLSAASTSSTSGGTSGSGSVSAGGAQKPMRLVTKWHQLEDGKAYQLDSSGKSNAQGSLDLWASIDS